MEKPPPDLAMILENLGNGPGLLRNLMDRIPEPIRKDHRIPGKWCIHSHACHIVDVQPMLMDRLRRFLAESSPAFIPYIPDGEDAEVSLHGMDLDERLDSFPVLRAGLLELIRKAPQDLWGKSATHPEYGIYTPEIMIRHIMMHDYLHMYRIEEIWLTKPEFLPVR